MNIAQKLTATVCVAATFASCAKTGDSTIDTAAADTAPAEVGTVAPSTVGPGAQTTTEPATGESGQIHIVLREWSVNVSKSPIRAGRTTFHAMNEGKYQHAFEIEGNGQGWTVEPVKPAGTATLTADLTPGTYKVYCPIVDNHGNHQGRGMSTTMVVQ